MMGLRLAKEGVSEKALQQINPALTFETMFSANLLKRMEEHDYIKIVQCDNDRKMIATRNGISVLDTLLGTLFEDA